MQLQQLLTFAFATSALGATFVNFKDATCQRSDTSYYTVTAAQLEDLAVQEWPSATPESGSQMYFIGANQKDTCVANKQDTYAYVPVPLWNSTQPGQEGQMGIIYHDDTDTYYLCTYFGAIVGNYAGLCESYPA